MKTIELVQTEHSVKLKDKCPTIEPNIRETCLLVENGKRVGAYISSLKEFSPKLSNIVAIANEEFNSSRVPKSLLQRSSVMQEQREKGISRADAIQAGVSQMSTIIGAVKPNAMKRRPFTSLSQVHLVKNAKVFIQAMLKASELSEEIISNLLPDTYEKQLKEIQEIDKKFRFGNLFTSSICNYNISAPYHIDSSNLKNTVNVIFTKRMHATGGCLSVPDYGAVFEQHEDSMLIYPAWRNVHGVTPIKQLFAGGYRNSLVLYPLNLKGQT